jgi:hypothetical protein
VRAAVKFVNDTTTHKTMEPMPDQVFHFLWAARESATATKRDY